MENSNFSEQETVQSVKFTQNQQAYFAEIRQKQDKQRRFGISYFGKIWFIPLIFGALFPLCLYKNEYGILWPVFLCIALFLVHMLAKRLSDGTIDEYENVDYVEREKSKFSIFCIVTIILLSIEVCTSMSLSLVTQSKVLMLVMTLIYLWHVFAPKIETGLLNTIKILVISFFYPLTRLTEPISDMNHFFKKKKAEEQNSNAKKGSASAVLLGLVISIPVLIVVVALLATADLVFGKAVHGMFNWVKVADAYDYFWIIFFCIAGIWFSYCVVKGLIEENEYFSDAKPAEEKHSATSAIAFSIPITIVYIIFILIQLIFLLGHFSLPKGMTYAEYAHQGFYQLIAVAMINLFIILIIQHFFDESRALKAVLMVLSICTYGMIFSSAARLFMYIDAYAMTFQRVYALFFLAVLAVWLGALIVKIKNPGKSIMRFCIVSAVVMFLCFAFSHPDYWMAKYDIAKWESEGVTQANYLENADRIDQYYLDSLEPEDEPTDQDFKNQEKYDYILYQLSYDAVPAISNEKLRKQALKSYKSSDGFYGNGNSASIYRNEVPNEFQKMRNFNFSRYFAGQ